MCKKSKPTKSTEQYKILRMISRDEQFDRNGGGQFVSMNRVYKDKSKYNRKDMKKELRRDLNSFSFSYLCETTS
jgi:hypothetical protein